MAASAATGSIGGAPALTAVGGGARLWTSEDGRLRSERIFPDSEARLYWVVSSPNVVLAGGAAGIDGAIWWSTDAERWNRATLPGAEGWQGAQDGWPGDVRGVRLAWTGPGRDRWYAFGTVPRTREDWSVVTRIWSSVDGQIWVRLPDRSLQDSGWIYDVWADGEGRLVTAGSTYDDARPVAWWSDDSGVTWQPYAMPEGRGSIHTVVGSVGSRPVGLGSVNVGQTPLSGTAWVLRERVATSEDLSTVIRELPQALAPLGDDAYAVIGRAWPGETGSWDADYAPGA